MSLFSRQIVSRQSRARQPAANHRAVRGTKSVRAGCLHGLCGCAEICAPCCAVPSSCLSSTPIRSSPSRWRWSTKGVAPSHSLTRSFTTLASPVKFKSSRRLGSAARSAPANAFRVPPKERPDICAENLSSKPARTGLATNGATKFATGMFVVWSARPYASCPCCASRVSSVSVVSSPPRFCINRPSLASPPPPSRRLGPAPSAPLLRPRRPPRAGRAGSTYTSLSSTPGANRVAPRVKSGSRKSAARLRTMATFGFCGLCCRGRGVGASRVSGSRTGDVDRELEHREPCSDTPDVRELGESSRPPPVSPEEKIRLLARSYARSFNKDGVFSLPVLLPRLRPPSPALGGRTETSGTAPVDATPSPPSSLRNTTRAGGAALAPPMRGEFLALKRAPSSFTLA